MVARYIVRVISDLEQAMIRDTKEYVTKNAGPILVGGTVISTANFTWEQVTFLSCIINGDQNDTSRADYVGFSKSLTYCTVKF